MKKYRVFGNANITVSTIIEFPDNEELTAEEIFERACDTFEGISSFVGNGGTDKLIGVCGEDDTIDADSVVDFDDFELLEDL